MRRLLFIAIALTVIALCPAAPQAHAADVQTPPPAAQAPASLHGRVLDPSGAPIAGASVIAAPADHGTAIRTLTDARGEFSLSLRPGRCTIRIEAPGFAALDRTIDIADRVANVGDFTLRIAARAESVQVAAPEYNVPSITSATKTAAPLRDVPQSVTVVTEQLIKDQMMLSLGDVMRYVPGAAQHQGENNRDEVLLRGNDSSANFYVDGIRDDVQYYRDLYDLDRVEVLKGPNALIFGRGDAGGVVNRVTKQAEFGSFGSALVEGGSFDSKRVSSDLNTTLSPKIAVRFNGVYENSGSFRSRVGLERYGLTPTLTWTPSTKTTVTVGYQHFYDRRTADRGVSSYQGRPVDVPIDTYFGDPNNTGVWAHVDLTNATVEHRSGALTIRSHTLFGDYNRGYQNFVPGAVSTDGTQLALTAYNNATARRNLFNQTDLTYSWKTGRLRHTILAGAEEGLQLTDNFRNTGFFNNTAASIMIPLSAPTISVPTTFRQSATDADNHLQTTVAAAYAQDQLALSDHIQLVGGVRVDRFDLIYRDNRSGAALERVDDLISPRAGIVIKPVVPLSLYGSYSVSYLPSSGDQFSSLTTITQQVQPEKFSNYEVGAKWDHGSSLALTTALYRLDRTNTRAADPNDPTRIVQTGSQRTNGYEFGISGRLTSAWSVSGGGAFQHAFVTSATTAAPAGAIVGLVPRQTMSLWSRYQASTRLGVGVGVIYRSDMFAAISDTVTLPGYARADAAGYWTLTRTARLQINVENLFNKKYFLDADSNTNISFGSSRAIRLALMTTF